MYIKEISSVEFRFDRGRVVETTVSDFFVWKAAPVGTDYIAERWPQRDQSHPNTLCFRVFSLDISLGGSYKSYRKLLSDVSAGKHEVTLRNFLVLNRSSGLLICLWKVEVLCVLTFDNMISECEMRSEAHGVDYVLYDVFALHVGDSCEVHAPRYHNVKMVTSH